MIAEVNTLESAGLRPAVPAAGAPPLDSAEYVEGEIARLTWAMLDGSASPHDRHRLAELVRSQHARRRGVGV
jgi:hypothetical protein